MMLDDNKKNIYDNFPDTIKKKIEEGTFAFPEGTEFEYSPFLGYRVVKRKEGESFIVRKDDFKSYYELGKKLKRARGIDPDEYTKMAEFYGVSLFKDIRYVKQMFKIPTPKKKALKGNVSPEGGPQFTNGEHVCWWLYENVDLSDFKLCDEEEYFNEK